MTNNKILARWQGWEPKEYDVEDFDGYVYQEYEPTPDYLNDDAAAMSLLDTLVERRYGIELKKHRVHELWNFEIIRDDLLSIESNFIIAACRDTRREAVVAAVLELIRKEDV